MRLHYHIHPEKIFGNAVPSIILTEIIFSTYNSSLNTSYHTSMHIRTHKHTHANTMYICLYAHTHSVITNNKWIKFSDKIISFHTICPHVRNTYNQLSVNLFTLILRLYTLSRWIEIWSQTLCMLIFPLRLFRYSGSIFDQRYVGYERCITTFSLEWFFHHALMFLKILHNVKITSHHTSIKFLRSECFHRIKQHCSA